VRRRVESNSKHCGRMRPRLQNALIERMSGTRGTGVYSRRPDMLKRILRGIVKMVASLAGVVFLLDNRISGTGGTVLLGSIIVLFLCLFVWIIFLRDDADEDDTGYWPPPPEK
jgi:membrane glycosyltransferase